jgi:predicted O-methyltransferase YrrM
MRARELGALQKVGEHAALLEAAATIDPEIIVEIGSDGGGTLYAWREAFPNAEVIAINLEGGPYSSGNSLKAHGALVIAGDSHQPVTKVALEHLLNGRAIDVLFIDGDHTYKGVRQDIEMYSPLVRKGGGLVVLHDILQHPNHPEVEVDRAWEELRGGKKHEFTGAPRDWGGIGVLVRNTRPITFVERQLKVVQPQVVEVEGRKGNRLVIVLPMYGNVFAEWVQKFLLWQSNVATFVTKHRQDFAGIISTVTPYVDFAMNELVNEAMKSDRWDYMLILEQDNFAPDDLIDRVYNYDPEVHKIVGTLYFGRVQEDQRPVAGYFKKGKHFDRIPPDTTERMLRDPGLYEVDWVGMGCTAIHRSVFADFPKNRLPWFKNPNSRGKAMGHDVYFCTEAKRAGNKIWVDTRSIATHMGTWRSTAETYLATRRYNKEIGTGWDPHKISTELTEAELAKIAELAADKKVLEIGARVGGSTVAMAKTAHMVYSVDWHQGGEMYDAIGGQGDTLGAFWATVNFHQLRDKVKPMVGKTQDILPTLADQQYDLVFIDGDHTYKGVAYDLAQARRLIRPGGTIALHDFNREIEDAVGSERFGITKACEESLGQPDELVGTLAIYRDQPPLQGLHILAAS